jgi:hypothetical protein
VHHRIYSHGSVELAGLLLLPAAAKRVVVLGLWEFTGRVEGGLGRSIGCDRLCPGRRGIGVRAGSR